MIQEQCSNALFTVPLQLNFVKLRIIFKGHIRSIPVYISINVFLNQIQAVREVRERGRSSALALLFS